LAAGEPEALRPLAEEIWQIVYSKPMSLVDLCARCDACALKIYQAVAGMLRADLFASATVEKADDFPGAKVRQTLNRGVRASFSRCERYNRTKNPADCGRCRPISTRINAH